MRTVSLPLNYADLSSLLSLCGRETRHRLGSSIHAAILKRSNLFQFNTHADHPNLINVWNSLISMYSKCGHLLDAAKVFDEMTVKDTVTWNSLISGLVMHKELEKGFGCFKRMLKSEIYRCDHATLTTILSICAEAELCYACEMVHSLAILNGLGQRVSVGNALITAYFKCGCSNSAQRVFDGMHDRNVVTWTAMVSGMARSGLCDRSLVLFREMRSEGEPNSLTCSSVLLACSSMRALREGQRIHGIVVKYGFLSDLCVESSLMDVYSKCGMMDDAYRIFQTCRELDEVSLTVMLVGFSQNGLEEEAFRLFANMVAEGISIDADMVSAVLGAFGASAPFVLGRLIHSMVIKKCLGSNVFVCNGLINMYSKCGELGDSIKVFELMVHKNLVSWNSMIAAFARHGQGKEALQLYEDMKSEGMEPTDVTYLSLLHACSHVGSVEKGMEFLASMSLDHGITPRIEHYACVVDMLGRAGHLQEARRFIEGMPIEDNALLWQSLLGACGIHGNSEMGKYAAERLLVAAPHCPALYVVLGNIYSSEGRWEERARTVKKMKEMVVKKETGVSWIEIEKKVHSFVVEDKVHPHAELIYEVLSELFALSKEQEYAVDKGICVL